jgi:hypothetical protein
VQQVIILFLAHQFAPLVLLDSIVHHDPLHPLTVVQEPIVLVDKLFALWPRLGSMFLGQQPLASCHAAMVIIVLVELLLVLYVIQDTFVRQEVLNQRRFHLYVLLGGIVLSA